MRSVLLCMPAAAINSATRQVYRLRPQPRTAPQLLLLDEPTNNLDLLSVGQLEAALRAYRGAFVVVSHDERFLEAIAVHRRWRLADGRLRR